MSDNKEYVGKVIWFNSKRGFGFAEWNKDNVAQRDIFVHYSYILMGGYKQVKQDQMIAFQLGTNQKGMLIATNIRVLGT